MIPAKIWNKFWEIKGKKGPESGWDIPTSDEIKKAVNEFN
jgi:hypothetical protein